MKKNRVFGFTIQPNIFGTGVVEKLIRDKKHLTVLVFLTLIIESHRYKEKRYIERVDYFTRKLNITKRQFFSAINDINFYSKSIDFLDENLTFIPAILLKYFVSPDSNYGLIKSLYHSNNKNDLNHDRNYDLKNENDNTIEHNENSIDIESKNKNSSSNDLRGTVNLPPQSLEKKREKEKLDYADVADLITEEEWSKKSDAEKVKLLAKKGGLLSE